jgi:hypothetical protein
MPEGQFAEGLAVQGAPPGVATRLTTSVAATRNICGHAVTPAPDRTNWVQDGGVAGRMEQIMVLSRPIARLAASLAFCAGLASASQAAATDAAHPVVVELFQSQGCSSCPPANANVAAIADRPDVLALSFSVTYWDQLGWKDTFARPEFTARQWAYAHALRHPNVFTPQVVVNGRADGVGVDRNELWDLIRTAARANQGPAIAIGPGEVVVGGAPAAGPSDVWLVRYDPRIIEVPIRRGENGGKTLPHKNIVRGLVRLGSWRGQPVRFALPPSADPAWRVAILVQAAGTGPILAAARG